MAVRVAANDGEARAADQAAGPPTLNGGGTCVSYLDYAPACRGGAGLRGLAPSVEAQLQVVHENRFEITPFGGYQWGGCFDTDAGNLLGVGQLEIADAFGLARS